MSLTLRARRTRVLAGGTLVVALGAAGVLGTVSANAESPQSRPAAASSAPAAEVSGRDTTTTTHLTTAAATRAAQAALDAAQRAHQKVSVAVVDRDGRTVVTLRGDGAGPQSYESAVKKAYTAVSWNAPTSDLVKRLDSAPTLKDIPGTLFLAGGAPVTAKGAPVAAVGVAGAPSGDQDETFAKAGVAALGR
ncbi:heme-binding protein [Streptomyces sp. SID11385]|uniref:GlcG/HbpS family heme-binding protein n=1 Tax=Streptomyces sp. SID11385 TaxID=2706031 RepID=UPI0013C8B492|nr:heme-binding protein [Streptomyces sp. SID11385]NEA41752.1 heme-binding protein [Streptomyces sp. SID11385]